MRRGEIWWADLGLPSGSEPGFRRPVVIIQSDQFNASRIGTIVAAGITSNLDLVKAPGNVLLRRKASKLPKDSVVNVTQLLSIDRGRLSHRISHLQPAQLAEIDAGLRLVLAL